MAIDVRRVLEAALEAGRKRDEAERAAYLGRYREGVAKAYPPQADGSVLLPFPRLFLVATK